MGPLVWEHPDLRTVPLRGGGVEGKPGSTRLRSQPRTGRGPEIDTRPEQLKHIEGGAGQRPFTLHRPFLNQLEEGSYRYVARLSSNPRLERMAWPHVDRIADKAEPEDRTHTIEFSYPADPWSRIGRALQHLPSARGSPSLQALPLPA